MWGVSMVSRVKDETEKMGRAGRKVSCTLSRPSSFLSFHSWNAEKLMRLQAEPPARVGQAVVHGERRISRALGAVHRLQEEVAELQILEVLRAESALGIDQLHLASRTHVQLRSGLGAHAEPVELGRRRESSVVFHGD